MYSIHIKISSFESVTHRHLGVASFACSPFAATVAIVTAASVRSIISCHVYRLEAKTVACIMSMYKVPIVPVPFLLMFYGMVFKFYTVREMCCSTLYQGSIY